MLIPVLLAHGQGLLQIWAVIATVGIFVAVMGLVMLALWLVRRSAVVRYRGMLRFRDVMKGTASAMVVNFVWAGWLETTWPKWLGEDALVGLAAFVVPGLVIGWVVVWTLARRQAHHAALAHSLWR